jgi:hypothetical protein
MRLAVHRIGRAALIAAAGAVCVLALASTASAAPVVRSAAGTDPAAIQRTVDEFRADLGALNPNQAQTFEGGRREINWDGVPDALASPNSFPANFFNTTSPRGVVFSTPGTGFQVSSSAASGVPVRFGNIDPAYTNLFRTFSPQRLFTPIGSIETTVDFFQAGTTTAATSTGFGSVFTDVNLSGPTSIEYFDAAGDSLGSYSVPATGGNATLSFLGVSFNEGERVAKVIIRSGNQVLAPGNTADDLVVMDDFVYGEPRAVPPPALTLKLNAKGKQSAQGLAVKATCSNNCEFEVKAKGKADGRKFSSKKTGDDLPAGIKFTELIRFKQKTLNRIKDEKAKTRVIGTATDDFGQTVTEKKKVTLKP